jgi:hypothetical protein
LDNAVIPINDLLHPVRYGGDGVKEIGLGKGQDPPHTVVTEKSIYREYIEVAVFHSEL